MDSQNKSYQQEEWFATPIFLSSPADLTIKLDDAVFHVHKDILEKSCDYFKAMFQSPMLENEEKIITLKEMDPLAFQILLESFYKEELSINHDTMFSVAEIANMLQIKKELNNQLVKYFSETMEIDNCLQIMFFAKAFNLQEIFNVSKRFCLAYFIEICKSKEYLGLSKEQLTYYLSSDHLCIDNEAEVNEDFIT